jgi:hypothetical protein
MFCIRIPRGLREREWRGTCGVLCPEVLHVSACEQLFVRSVPLRKLYPDAILFVMSKKMSLRFYLIHDPRYLIRSVRCNGTMLRLAFALWYRVGLVIFAISTDMHQ